MLKRFLSAALVFMAMSVIAGNSRAADEYLEESNAAYKVAYDKIKGQETYRGLVKKSRDDAWDKVWEKTEPIIWYTWSTEKKDEFIGYMNGVDYFLGKGDEYDYLAKVYMYDAFISGIYAGNWWSKYEASGEIDDYNMYVAYCYDRKYNAECAASITDDYTLSKYTLADEYTDYMWGMINK
jgi:hypothetical protein